MENMHRARTGRQKCSASMLSPGILLSTSQCGHQHWSSPKPPPRVFFTEPTHEIFMEASFCRHHWWNHWLLVIKLRSRDSKSLRNCMQGPVEKTRYFFSYTTAIMALGCKVVFGQHFNRWNHERGKRQNPWRIRVTWWMDREKVKLDPRISCYSHGCKPGTTLKWDTKTLEEQKGPVLVPAF